MAGSLYLVRFDQKQWQSVSSEEGVADFHDLPGKDAILGNLNRPYDAIELVTEVFGKSYQLDICELSKDQWQVVLEKARQKDTDAPERLEEFIKLLSDVLEVFDFEENTLTFYFCH